MPRVRTLVFIIIATVLMAACGDGGGSSSAAGSSNGKDCLAATAASKDEPVIAVLPGVTTSDTSEAIQQDRRATFSTVMTAGFTMKARLVADVIGSGVGDAQLAINARLKGEGANDLFRNQDVKCKQSHLIDTFNRLVTRTTDGPTDILSALRTLQAHLVGLPKTDVEVVLLTDMVSTSPSLNLADPTSLKDGINKAIDALIDRQLVPDCRGWRVYAVGAGRTPDGGLNGERDEQLHQFWSAFFQRCGGQLVVYDTQLTTFPVTATTGDAWTPPKSEPINVHPVGASFVANIPSTVLFDVDQSNLKPDADGALAQLVDLTTQRYPTSRITVIGYTDSTGTPDHNVALSQSRADAVRDWLIAQGVAAERVTSSGRGADDPVADNSTAEGRRQNRRVQITVTP